MTCSYAETIRFKASAAVDTATKTTFGSKVITDSKDGLIQVVADNFDVNISSQNGTKSTHALALITTQPKANTLPSETDVIKRIRSEDVYKLVVPGVQIAIYNGRAKPQMLPFTQNQKGFPTLIELAKSVAKTFAVKEAEETSALFFRRIISDEKTPEFHGFCTMTKRESGASPKPSTNTFYSPLIDMTPHDPDCIMTAMTEAMRITHGCGQEYTVFTTDQQLYRVTLNVLWSHPSTFQKFIPRLGGMHMLMSFVGCVGKLMANSGLDVVMKSAFGGVPKMLLGKNFPQNTRALRIVVEEILNPLVKESTSFDNLMDLLKDKSQQSRTAKLWVECLIKPVFLMMMFVKAEREANWLLHLECVERILPYFFAAGHVNYARYGMFYLQDMQRLPTEVLAHFLKGEHVMRHRAGLWNAIWSDMFIESTFMRFGKSTGGLVGITLKPSALSRWALSLHACSNLTKGIGEMRDNKRDQVVMHHREESASRRKSDDEDRQNIRNRLETCIDPLNCPSNADQIVNVVTSKVGPQSVNVDDAVALGHAQMVRFEQSMPEGFH